MTIGIDIDDTTADTTAYLLEDALEYDKNILHKNGIVYKEKNLPRCFAWTNEEIKCFLNDIFRPKVLDLPVKKGAKEAINKLKSLGYKIAFITARTDDTDDIDNSIMIKNCQKWLAKNKINYDKLIVGAKLKGEFCQKEKVDFFIDDSPYQCQNVLLASPHTKVIKFSDYPSDNLKTFNNWEDVLKYILENSDF